MARPQQRERRGVVRPPGFGSPACWASGMVTCAPRQSLPYPPAWYPPASQRPSGLHCPSPQQPPAVSRLKTPRGPAASAAGLPGSRQVVCEPRHQAATCCVFSSTRPPGPPCVLFQPEAQEVTVTPPPTQRLPLQGPLQQPGGQSLRHLVVIPGTAFLGRHCSWHLTPGPGWQPPAPGLGAWKPESRAQFRAHAPTGQPALGACPPPPSGHRCEDSGVQRADGGCWVWFEAPASAAGERL